MTIVVLSDVSELPSAPDVDVAAARSTGDAALALVEGGIVRAVAALWWHEVPRRHGRTAGFIGRLSGDGQRSLTAVLEAAAAALAARGVEVAFAPVDGSTWGRYRAVVASSPQPPFAFEPITPAFWPDALAAAGFSAVEHYVSARHRALDHPRPNEDALAHRFAARGLTVRKLDPHDATGDLVRIHALAERAFVANPLFSPLSREAFVAMYAPLAAATDAALVRLAEADGELEGFVFALLDDATVPFDGAPTVVVKTVATVADPVFRGLGMHLVAGVEREAAAMGAASAIHALMHVDNISTAFTRRHGEVFRRYAVFARDLEATPPRTSDVGGVL